MSKRSRLAFYLAAAAATVLVLAWLGQRLTVSYRTPLTECVVDAGTGGGLGVSRWAERLGYHVRAVEVPVWQAPPEFPAGTGNCILSAGNGPWPTRDEDASKEDWESVRRWLAAGNALILVTTAPDDLPEFVRQELPGSTSWPPSEKPGKATLWAADVPPDPITEDVPVATGGHLVVTADGPRWDMSDEKAGHPSQDRTRVAMLARDKRGAVLLRIALGKGAVYILLDSFAWTNAGLDHGENAAVLAGILNREVRGGVLAFDEFRHGHGRAESFLTYFLSVPGAGAALAIAALWAAFYVYGRNIRLRPAETYSLGERRTAQEYVDAVAQLHERARAAPLAVEAVVRRLRRLSRSGERSSAEAEKLLSRAEDYVARGQRPAAPGAARQLVTQLIRMRKQLYGSRTIS